MSPSKVQMQKCDKCSREFCSPLNYRRHIRMHRRPLNVDKDDMRKERMQLAAFWDKLTFEEASNIVSLKNFMIEDLSGAAAVRALTSQQHGLPSLPQSYVKAGASLLDIVQNKAPRTPLPSEELLSILDDSSEKTFLCGIISVPMQRFIFEGEAGKVGLETKNLVASLGLLFEQRLVNAWMVDKDAEALRCEKALVEEEEAAQKKRAKLQERKRLKKIRQKEMKDKERKVIESSSSFQMLNINLDGGNRPDHGDGDDSPTASQSSPSSSAYSGQDLNHPGLLNVELNEFDICSSGKVDNMFLRLADEESLGDDDQHAAAWTGMSNTYKIKVDVEDPSDSGTAVVDPGESIVSAAIDGNMENFDSCNRDEIQETAEYQNSYPNQRTEHGNQFLELNMRGPGRFFSDRKAGQGWRERKRYEVNEFNGYQKPNYGTDCGSYQRFGYFSERRFYDVNSQHNQKVTRKPYSLAGNFSQESPVSPTISKSHVTPRYGQYRDKPLGLRRNLPTVSNGHAVWTRKVQHDLNSESEKVGKDDRDSKPGNTEACSSSMDLPGSRQLENVFLECERPETSKASEKANAVSFVRESLVSDNISAVATLSDTRTTTWLDLHDKADGTLSCDSSVSYDSGSSQSSASVSARVGAEEHASNKDIRAISCPTEETAACILRHVASDGSSVSDWDSLEASPEIGDASGALYIGSLSISLGNSSGLFSLKTSGSAQEKLKQLSKDIDSLHVKKQRGATGGASGFLTSVGEVSKDQRFSTIPENKSVIENEHGASAGGEMCGDSFLTERVLKSQQSIAGESADVRHISSHASMQEKLVKQGSLPNGVNKVGTLKVWRPVGIVGECQDTPNKGPVSRLDQGLALGDKCALDSTSNGGLEHREMEITDCMKDEKDRAESCSQSAISTESRGDDGCHEMKFRLSSDVRLEESSGCDEVTSQNGEPCSDYLEVDVLEVGNSTGDPSNSIFSAEDECGRKILSSQELKSSCLLSVEVVAGFLSQRWMDAIGALESSVLEIHAADSHPYSVIAETDVWREQSIATVSSCSADEGNPSMHLQDENRSLHRTREQGLQNAQSNMDLSTESGPGLETGLGSNEHIRNLHTSSGNAANITATDLAMVHASDKVEESKVFSAATIGRTGVKLDKWHRNARMRVSESRYMPRRSDFDEMN